jgi:hypothetical protein
MTDHAELEIRLRLGPDANKARLEPSLRLPGSDAPLEPPGGEDLVADFDLEGLEALWLAGDYEAYGQKLTACLFAASAVRTFLARARAATQVQDPPLPLRLRLRAGAGASEMHRLCWELLHDPEYPDRLLATDENVLLSRYLTSSDFRPVRTRPQAAIRALVVVANPANLHRYQGEEGRALAPVNVAEELERAREALRPIPITALCSADDLDCRGRPTLDEMVDHLRDGYDVLYLVAHGALSKDGEPLLWLEDAGGQADVIAADDTWRPDGRRVSGLVSRLSEMPRLPRLVILASCQGAGVGDERASPDTHVLSALGPRLAEAGVPAVVAMQGSITMATVAKFMPALFKELRRDGQIDRAVAAARQAVQERSDWWMPVLFTRLESGELFSRHGRAVGDEPEAFWTRLLKDIGREKCTPFLGPDVTADLLPSPSDLARTLALEYDYPLPDCDSLVRVGQFVATHGYAGLCEDVVQSLVAGYRRRTGLPHEPGGPEVSLTEAVESSNWSERVQTLLDGEIHHQLADLHLPLYVTTNFDNFMTLALRARLPAEERDRVRRVALAWREQPSDEAGHEHSSLVPPPSRQDPVVLHLFGTDDDLLSMVLTEDDYLDYLARVFRDHQTLLPGNAKATVAKSSLLFLGYDLHDLAFKVILRGLLPNLNLKRWKRRHVAVQLEPSAVDQAHYKDVVDYLQDYFSTSYDVQVDVYWGSVHQFVSELHDRWTAWQQEQSHG